MKQKSGKRKFIILAFAVVILAISAFFLVQIPQRIAASQFNKKSDLPYNFLSSSDFSNADYSVISGGFGTKGYYNRKYAGEDDDAAEFDTSDRLLHGKIVIFWVSSYPDAVLGSSRITKIACSDPSYGIFGCHAGDEVGMFSGALANVGFKENSNLSYTKCGIRVVLTLDGESAKVAYFTVSVEPGNLFKVKY